MGRFGFVLCLAAMLLAVSATSAGARNAYVSNWDDTSVSVIDTSTNQVVGAPIGVGVEPDGVAITPDGARAYVANRGSGTLSVIDTATNEVVGLPVDVQAGPRGVAITPDGTRAYVTNRQSHNVSVIDLATNQEIGPPIAVVQDPIGVAVTPDGSRAYVANQVGSVSVIDTATNAVVGAPIDLGGGSPRWVAITPDGSRVHVLKQVGELVAIDPATNQVVGSPIPIPSRTFGLAITPDGARGYVGDLSDPNVYVVDLAAGQLIMTISLDPPFSRTYGVAISPDGSRAYTTSFQGDNVRVIETATNQEVAAPIPVGDLPTGIAIVPNQGPTAAFSAAAAPAGQPTSFDASASSDPDGQVARYDWDFGDGTTVPDGGPTPTHTYAQPGNYTATLRVTDNEGCSTELVHTGQTAHCNGGPAALASEAVAVGAPAPPDGDPLNLPAKLLIARAQVRVGASAASRHPVRRLVIRGSLDPRAAGERVMGRFRARGRQIVIRPVVQANGAFQVNRRLRGPQRRAVGGQLRLRYAGNDVLRAVGERLRAARRAVRLRIARVRLRGNRLVVAGRVRPRARRQARIQVEFNRPNGDPAQLATRARVRKRGRFRTTLRVSPAVRNLGGWVSITHRGRARLHGQRRGRAVGG